MTDFLQTTLTYTLWLSRLPSTAATTINYNNFLESIKEWTNVLGQDAATQVKARLLPSRVPQSGLSGGRPLCSDC
jgi:hypothetical protein